MRYKYCCDENGGVLSEHRYNWICYNGKIPKGYHIHHKNWDRLNNGIENLMLMSTKLHCRLHHFFPILNLRVKHILKLGYSEKGYENWLRDLPSPLREHIVNGGRICDIVNEWDKLWT